MVIAIATSLMPVFRSLALGETLHVRRVDLHGIDWQVMLVAQNGLDRSTVFARSCCREALG
jgi:hypothetical protein